MYKTFFFITLILSMACNGFSEKVEDSILLVFDNDPKITKSPSRLRYSTNPVRGVNTEGLGTLNIIGSGAYTEKQLEKIVTGKEVVYVVDLREESHGFINGTPICWYQGMNEINYGKTIEEIERTENQSLSKIIPGKTIPIAKIRQKHDGTVNAYKWYYPRVEAVMKEEELVKQKGLFYQRFYVTNHRRPSDSEVDRFLDFAAAVPQDAWLYFHCRAGSGRTTTFMVMYDILKNGDKVSLQEIVKRHVALGGHDLLTLPPPNNHKYEAARERKQFIERFYRYAASGPKNHRTWSEWAR